MKVKTELTNETKKVEPKGLWGYSIGRTRIVESENWEDIVKAFKEHNKGREENKNV